MVRRTGGGSSPGPASSPSVVPTGRHLPRWGEDWVYTDARFPGWSPRCRRQIARLRSPVFAACEHRVRRAACHGSCPAPADPRSRATNRRSRPPGARPDNRSRAHKARSDAGGGTLDHRGVRRVGRSTTEPRVATSAVAAFVPERCKVFRVVSHPPPSASPTPPPLGGGFDLRLHLPLYIVPYSFSTPPPGAHRHALLQIAPA